MGAKARRAGSPGAGTAAGSTNAVVEGDDHMRLFDLDVLAGMVPEGAVVAIPPDNSATAAAFARALVRQGARGLRLVGVPVSGYATDLLIGAGCVAEVQSSAVSLDEAGPAPCFTRAVKAGTIRMLDATCPAMHSMLEAATKGIPFIPIRGILGSDLLAHRPDWQVIDNPYAEGDRIVLLPALVPDFSVFHAVMADREGNVWVGRHRELAVMAHAARRSLVTVERIVEDSLLENERLAPGTISAAYVEAVAIAERGAWPGGLVDEYPDDAAHFSEYAALAKSEEGFRAYLGRHVYRHAHGQPAAAE
jgi:glutaconate CoA-transferase, subunit A